MKKRLFSAIIAVSMIIGGIFGYLALSDLDDDTGNPATNYDVSYSELEKFGSYAEIEDFLESNAALSGGYYYFSNLSGQSYYFGFERGLEMDDVSADSDGDFAPGGSNDHSETNVQVEGVDEGDIVKNDGEYAYIVSRNRTKVFIVDVYPPENARIVSEIEISWNIVELYLNEDKLVVVGGTRYDYYWYYDYEYYTYTPEVFVNVYDIEDKANPELTRSVSQDGSYVGSRIIGDYLYLIIRQYSSSVEKESDLPVAASEIYFAPEYDYYYTYTTIMSLNVQNKFIEPNKEVILMGTSTHIYVSTKNIYLSYLKRMSWVENTEKMVDEVILPMVPHDVSSEIRQVQNSGDSRYDKLIQIDRLVGQYEDTLTDSEMDDYNDEWYDRNMGFQENIQRDIEKTMIHRIRVDKGDIQYEASGAVPGYVLNRFSMDEHNENFRIATTTGQLWGWGESVSKNHVYVTDMDLSIVGALEDIAPGERIFAARFMGKRAYLVTFINIDPFFVIDLSNPENPTVLGELKIPGFSNYLHPYDENHVIGIGKDAVDMGDFAWFQGVKLSLFDVSDVKNPKEVSNYIVGDRGTDSLALTDPHAFLFSKDKNLLVMPILLAEIDDSKYPGGPEPSTWGEYTFCGAYVFTIDTITGINLKGRITHTEDPDDILYWYRTHHRIKRSFYIEDYLYTVSDYLLMASDLSDLSEISTVELQD
jgi:uncharacterized secreted protein with C-terminal beta-propeller domain